MDYLDIHTHQNYTDNTRFVYNAHLESVSTHMCSVGIHPLFINNADQQLQTLKWLLQTQKNIVAIGECGLDKYAVTEWSTQTYLLEQQLKLAEQYQKPVIIHCVKAYNECLHILSNSKVPVIFHGFNKHPQVAQQIIKSKHYISLGYTALAHKDRMLAYTSIIPKDLLFIETDNIPQPVNAVYQAIASLYGIAVNELKDTIQENFLRITSL